MRNKVASSDPENAVMEKPDARNQLIAAGIVSGVATLTIGTVLGFSAILLPQLENEEVLSNDEKSWIASLSNIGQLAGSIATGILSGKFGRKYTIMILCVPLIAGWVTIGLSQGNVLCICVGRILQGVGVMSSVTQVYLVEIADTEHRGMFGASGAMSVSAGIILTYCLGALLHWRFVCLVCGLIPAFVLLLMLPMPETPPWLILNGRLEAAKKSLQWLRGANYNISEELEGLQSSQGKSGDNVSLLDTIKTFRYPGAYKPFLILLVTFMLQQLTGTYAVIFYAVNLFKDIGVSTNPYIPAILTGTIRLVGTFIGTYLLKHFGRKPLMTVSAVLMAVFMASLATTLHFKENFYAANCQNSSTNKTDCTFAAEVEDSTYIQRAVYDVYPAVAVVLYMLAFGIGVGTVPWLLLGELCPSKVKGVAAGVAVFVAFITIFGVVKTFPFALQYLKPSGTYALYALMCLITGLFTWIFVPETRGKPLAEIQAMYGNIQ